MGYLKAYYDGITRLSAREWDYIASRFSRQVFPKGETITRQGCIEQYLYFLEEGIVRSFIPDDERELTFHFSFQKTFACAYDSFLTRLPSGYTLEAMTKTIAWRISYEALQAVYENTQVGNYIGRFAAEQLFLSKSRRELSLLQQTATARYLQLISDQPQMFQEVPLKYIASYIGITPQALSRIRRRIC